MRARMAIAAADQRVELREVVLRDKPALMLEVSSKATVPVLVLPDGVVVDESLDVMLWALRINDPLRWLGPESGDIQGMIELVTDCDGEFKYHLDRYKYANRYDGAVAVEHRDAALVFLARLEKCLANGPYLFGQRPSLSDYAIMPFIRQFANTDRTWFDQAPYPGLQAWLGELLVSETFTGVMKKYPQWQVGQNQVLFPS